MTEYENEFSNFPTKMIEKHNYKNIDDSIASLINQINFLRSQGLHSQAARTIQNNKAVLSKYIIDATTFRMWEEEIYNTQKYAKKTQQTVYIVDKEPDCFEEDVWIGR